MFASTVPAQYSTAKRGAPWPPDLSPKALYQCQHNKTNASQGLMSPASIFYVFYLIWKQVHQFYKCFRVLMSYSNFKVLVANL